MEVCVWGVEKLVFILVILYIQEYLCVFTKLFMGNRDPKISNFGYPVPEITENAQPYVTCAGISVNNLLPQCNHPAY